MADKINIAEDFFESFGAEELGQLIKQINLLQNTYNGLISETVRGLKEVKAASSDLVKQTGNYEKILKGLNVTLEEDQKQLKTIAPILDKMTGSNALLAKNQEVLTIKLKEEVTQSKELAKTKQLIIAQSGKAAASFKAQAGSIEELRAKVAQAKKQYESLGDDIDPFLKNKALENYAKYKKQLDESSKSAAQAVKANNTVADSLVGMRLELSEMIKTYNNFSESQRNSAEGQAFLKNLNDQREAIEQVENSMGNYTRGVGRYAEGFGQAIRSSGLFSNQLNALNDIQETAAALLKVVRGEQVATNAAMAAGGPAASIFANAMKVVKLALLSTGIGAFVVIVGSLIAFFQRTEEGAEKLERAMSAIGGVVDVLIGSFASVGKDLVAFFENPKAAAKSFLDFLQDQVINRVKSFGVILEGIQKGDFKKIANGVLQFGTGVEDSIGKVNRLNDGLKRVTTEAGNAARAYSNITRAQQDLEDAQLAAEPIAERLRGQIEQLMLQAKERTKSEKERLAGLKQAGVLENQLTQQRLGFAQQELEIALRREQLDRRSGKLDNGTRSEEAVAAEVKYQQILNESANQRQQIANRESVFLKEINQERLEAARAAAVERLRDEEVQLQRRLLNAQEHSQEELEIRKKLLDVGAKIEIASEEKTKNEIALINTKAQSEKKKLDADYFKYRQEELEKQAQQRREFEKAEADFDREQVEKALANLDKIAAKKNSMATEKDTNAVSELTKELESQAITIEEFNNKRRDLETTSGRESLVREIQLTADKLKVQGLSVDDTLKLEQELVEKRHQLYLKDADNAIKAEEDKLKKREFLINAAANIANTASDAIFQFAKDRSDRELQRVTEQKDAEMAKITEAENHALATSSQSEEVQKGIRESFAKQRERKEQEFEQRKAALAERAARREKAQSLFSIAINTAAAVASVLSTGGGTRYADFGISAGILSAFVIAQGALQAALVLSKPIPKFFKGVKNFMGGLAMVGEQGQELIEENGKVRLTGNKAELTVLEKGANVYTAPQTRTMLKNFKEVEEKQSIERVKSSVVRSTMGIKQADQVRIMHQYALQAKAQPDRDKELLKEMKLFRRTLESIPLTNIGKDGVSWLKKQGESITKSYSRYFPNGTR